MLRFNEFKTGLIVSEQNCRVLNPGQFCLNTIRLFALKAGFEFVWLMSSFRIRMYRRRIRTRRVQVRTCEHQICDGARRGPDDRRDGRRVDGHFRGASGWSTCISCPRRKGGHHCRLLTGRGARVRVYVTRIGLVNGGLRAHAHSISELCAVRPVPYLVSPTC